jgi:cytochrome c5
MDNKYALGSTKVATEHHEITHKHIASKACKFCGSAQLTLCPTMHDHKCSDCGEWQQDIEKSYATGRSSEY